MPESEKDGFRVWVNSNIRNHRKRQNLLKEHFTEADKKEFKSRNLNDTRYLNKLLLNYINDNLLFTDFYNGKKKHVTSVNGAVTAYIRKRWGINKNREDGDLHHAVDAAVIACVTQGIINRITAYSARNEAPYDLNTETGEIKERFPLPYPNFKKELDARTTIEDEKRLKRVLMSFSNYSYDDVEKAKPCFVSRTPHRKVTGAAHEETIRSGKVEGFTVSKTELTKLKLTNGEIEGYYEPESDTLLYNALLQRLNEFGGDAKAAFADEFHKPKADGTPGPVVKKVKTIKRSSSNVKARNKNGLGVADNGSMIRIDVFYVENEGYYFVPIYVADTVKEMPNEACPFGKDKKKIMTDDDFLFSLYPNDLIKITAKKDMKFSVDEWGVWAVPSNTVNNELNEEPWQIAPAISEQIYTLEDALLFAEMQMVILRNADAIKIACQSLLTNISACIMTEKGGNHWLQTIYYPFYYFANYAKGIVMKTMSDGPAYSCKEFPKVSYIDSLSVWNKEENELVFFAVNRDEFSKQVVSLQLSDFVLEKVIESISMTAGDKKMTNQYNHEAVKPKTVNNAKINNQEVKIELEPLSFNMVRIKIK